MLGSWAGAMGQCQFMPSTFLSYAVDFDGDGRRDIWNNRADVLGSIANYLSRLGWRGDESWGREVAVPGNFDTRPRRARKPAAARANGAGSACARPAAPLTGREAADAVAGAARWARRTRAPRLRQFPRDHEVEQVDQVRRFGRHDRRQHRSRLGHRTSTDERRGGNGATERRGRRISALAGGGAWLCPGRLRRRPGRNSAASRAAGYQPRPSDPTRSARRIRSTASGTTRRSITTTTRPASPRGTATAFDRQATANGEIYDLNELTAAHKTLPLPSVVEVTNLQNGRSLQLRVNDRGPYVERPDHRRVAPRRPAARLRDGRHDAGARPHSARTRASRSRRRRSAARPAVSSSPRRPRSAAADRRRRRQRAAARVEPSPSPNLPPPPPAPPPAAAAAAAGGSRMPPHRRRQSRLRRAATGRR